MPQRSSIWIGTSSYSRLTMPKKAKLKMTPKKQKLILMCIFLKNVRIPFGSLLLALLTGSAGDWPQTSQNAPKDYTNWHFCILGGVRNDPRVPIRSGRAPISEQHPAVRLHFGKVHRGTSKKFGAFLEVLFSLVLLRFEGRKRSK